MVSSAVKSSRSSWPSRPSVARHALGLLGDDLRRLAQVAVAQRRRPDHLAALLGRRVVDDALAEDRTHQLVRGGLRIEDLVGLTEERLLRLLAGEEHDVAVEQPEVAELAALRAHALEQAERIAAQRHQVSAAPAAAGERRDRRSQVLTSARPGLVLLELRSARRAAYASYIAVAM